ncbi:MAG: outer membrane protein assembly factor BamD, partial [Alphaproteobacteria bacterium]|nr:outer membrane protein assembly factor BamD [Alphaproteobacteria bacterium]
EMEIGRYYLRQGHYGAAINRFKAVIENYQTTTHVPEALHRLTEAFRALGVDEEARKTAAVLGHNFPGSEWYNDSYDLMEGKEPGEREKEPWYKFW